MLTKIKKSFLSLSPCVLITSFFFSFRTETPTNQAAMVPHGEGSEEALVVEDENRKPISSILIIIGTMLYFSVSYLFIWVSFVPLFMCFCVCNSYANRSHTYC